MKYFMPFIAIVCSIIICMFSYSMEKLPENLIATVNSDEEKIPLDETARASLQRFYSTGDPSFKSELIRITRDYHLCGHEQAQVLTTASKYKQCAPILERLLSENLCTIGIKTPAYLFSAVYNNNAAAILILMDYGAECSRSGGQSRNPLQLAKILRHTDCEEALQEMLEAKVLHILYNKFFDNNDNALDEVESLIQESTMNVNFHINNNIDLMKCNHHYVDGHCSFLFPFLDFRQVPLLYWAATRSSRFVMFLLQHGAVVDQKTVKHAKDHMEKIRNEYRGNFSDKARQLSGKAIDLYLLLDTYYEQQNCCVCYEHPGLLQNIPCKNNHQDSFLCPQCYEDLGSVHEKNGKKICPLCREALGCYFTGLPENRYIKNC